jgi:hypothetical protein
MDRAAACDWVVGRNIVIAICLISKVRINTFFAVISEGMGLCIPLTLRRGLCDVCFANAVGISLGDCYNQTVGDSTG